MARFSEQEQTRETHLAARILLGLAIMGIGILLVSLAFSSMSLGRPITHAWVAAVLGLVLLVPGAALTFRTIVSALAGRKQPPKSQNGPAPLRFT